MRSKANCISERLSTNLLPHLHLYFQRHWCCHFLILWGLQCLVELLWSSSPLSDQYSAFLDLLAQLSLIHLSFHILNSCCYCLLSHSLHPLSVCLFKISLLSFRWSFRKEQRLMLGVQPAIFHQKPSVF